MLVHPIDSAMLEAIGRIGHVMGERTIADYAQGYAIAKPKPFSVEAAQRRASAAS